MSLLQLVIRETSRPLSKENTNGWQQVPMPSTIGYLKWTSETGHIPPSFGASEKESERRLAGFSIVS